MYFSDLILATHHNPYSNAVVLYRVASGLLTGKKNGAPTTTQEYCQALQIENAHMAIMMDLHREHPEDEYVARDIPRIIARARRLQEQAAKASAGEEHTMALCDDSYPAVLFNSGIYHEVLLNFRLYFILLMWTIS